MMYASTEKHTQVFQEVCSSGQKYHGVTTGMQGKRKSMEDADQIKLCAKDDMHFMMVCDGHGGDFCAKQVAELMLPHILEKDLITKRDKAGGNSAERRRNLSEALESSFLEVDKKLLDLPPIENNDDFSGTTVCAAFITHDEVICANAGDTRCVLSTNKKAKVSELVSD